MINVSISLACHFPRLCCFLTMFVVLLIEAWISSQFYFPIFFKIDADFPDSFTVEQVCLFLTLPYTCIHLSQYQTSDNCAGRTPPSRWSICLCLPENIRNEAWRAQGHHLQSSEVPGKQCFALFWGRAATVQISLTCMLSRCRESGLNQKDEVQVSMD